MNNSNFILALVACFCLGTSCSVYHSPVPPSETPHSIDRAFIGEWEAVEISKTSKDSTQLFIDIIDVEGDSNAYLFTYSEKDNSYQDTLFLTLTASTISNEKILNIRTDEEKGQQFHFAFYKTRPTIEIKLIDEANFLDKSGKPQQYQLIDSLRVRFSECLRDKQNMKITESYLLRKRS